MDYATLLFWGYLSKDRCGTKAHTLSYAALPYQPKVFWGLHPARRSTISVRFFSGLLSAICLFVLTGAAFAQSDRGTITGTVLDEAKAVVPGATVTAKHTETGTISKTITTATGNYTLPSLPVGVYEVTIELAGFSKATQPRIQVQLAQTVRLDITLKVGAYTETITVTDEAPLLKTENAEQATNISGEMFNSLPLNFGGGGGQTGNIRGW